MFSRVDTVEQRQICYVFLRLANTLRPILLDYSLFMILRSNENVPIVKVTILRALHIWVRLKTDSHIEEAYRFVRFRGLSGPIIPRIQDVHS